MHEGGHAVSASAVIADSVGNCDVVNLETISLAQPSAATVATSARERRVALFNRVLIFLTVLYVLARAFPILSFPMGCDHGTYLTIGQGLLEGKQLYRDLWDNKPPGIFIAYAGIAKLFGRVSWGVPLVDILLLLLVSYLLFRFTEPYLGVAGAAITVMIHASMHGEMHYFWIAQPETFQVACLLTAYFLMDRRKPWDKAGPFLAGLVLGYACWLKYNAVAYLPFVLLLPFLDTRRLDLQRPRVSFSISWQNWLVKAALLLAGLATAIAIVVAWIVLQGAWPAMREAQFVVLPRYAAMAVERRPHYFLGAFVRTNYWLGVWNLWAVLAAILLGWFRRDLKRFFPLLLALLTSLAAVAMQVRFHDYYFQACYPFIAAVWAYLAVSFFEGCRASARYFSRHGWRLASGLVWLAFAQALFWPLPGEFSKLLIRYERLWEWGMDAEKFYALYPGQMSFEHSYGEFRVIDFLNTYAKPGDGVYVWSFNCQIYYLTGHQPPTRFVSNLGIVSLWSLPTWRGELMRDLRRSQPRFIVVARGDEIPTLTYSNLDSEQYLKTFPEFDAFISHNYKVATDFETFVVYERNLSG